jgi:OmcA/MtrC family decaheme c-type cytochrome
VKLCVVCHTDQLKYGSGDSKPTDGTPNLLHNGFYGSTQKLMGRGLADFPNMIHHIHAGEDLYFQGYDQFGVTYNDVAYPQQANCSKCHSASTPQGNNWNMVPSRKSCGGCHDNVDFAAGLILGTGAGHTVQLTDANCSAAGCHTAADIPVYHTFNDVTALNPKTPAGLGNFTYDIKSVTLNGSNQPVVTFRISLNGTPVTSFATLKMVNNVGNGRTVADPAYQPIPGYISGPSIMVGYGAVQDGITPNDFNARVSASLTGLLTPVGQPTNAGILSATPDANGYWTATLTGDPIGQPAAYTGWTMPVGGSAYSKLNPSPIAIPAGAQNITGAIYGSFTQVDQTTTYPWTPANYGVFPNVAATGGLLRPAPFKTVLATVTGNVARRTIVDSNKCNSCHDQLGTKPNFHGGAASLAAGAVGSGPRNEATACSFCHTVNQTSSGWAANASTFIHGIHGASKRTVPFTWHAPDPDDGYSFLLYPGVLNQCEQCHVPGSYDFSATANAAAIPNLLYTTVGTGTYAASVSTSPYVQLANNYGAGFGYTSAGVITQAAATTLVSSPITAACASCHDSAPAISHMKLNGGSFYAPRSTALARDPLGNLVTVEACLTCHGSGAIMDIKAVHKVQ